MLYQLLRDMWDILRLRYKLPADYRYSLPVTAAMLLLIGLVNAAAASQFFGKSTAAIVFAVLLTAVKWQLLSRAMSGILHYYGAPKMPLFGFVLASEALLVPSLLLFYMPALAPAGLFWQIWTFWVQAIGFIKMGNQPGWKIMLGYLVYVLLLMLAGVVLMLLFSRAGWLDFESVSQQIFNASIQSR